MSPVSPITNFEEIVNRPPAPLDRQYREMVVDFESISRVENNRGEYCDAPVSGAGYSSWYYYHTMDDRLVFIIESYGRLESSWSWQYGSPPRSHEEGIPNQAPQLIRSCTRFDCNCVEEGRRPCSTYNLCVNCNRSFQDCDCQI